MGTRGLKYRLFKSVVVRLLKHNNRDVVFPSEASVRRILLLIPGHDQELWESEIRRIAVLGTVDKLVFLDLKRQKGDDSKQIFKNDLNWIGVPKASFIQEACKIPYDLLIDLSDGSIGVFEYIVTASKAHFKVGSAKQEKRYDLIVGLPSDEKNGTIDRVLDIIKRLKSKH